MLNESVSLSGICLDFCLDGYLRRLAERFRGKIWYQNLPRKLGRVQREERRGKGARGEEPEVRSQRPEVRGQQPNGDGGWRGSWQLTSQITDPAPTTPRLEPRP